jgi:hypothetical protein
MDLFPSELKDFENHRTQSRELSNFLDEFEFRVLDKKTSCHAHNVVDGRI